MLHLGKLLEEGGFHGPIPDLVRMSEEHRGDLVPIVGRIVDKNVPIRVGPVEVEVFYEGFGKGSGRGVFLIFEDETITKGRP